MLQMLQTVKAKSEKEEDQVLNNRRLFKDPAFGLRIKFYYITLPRNFSLEGNSFRKPEKPSDGTSQSNN